MPWPVFLFDLSTNMRRLKVGLRKLSRDDQSEMEKLEQIMRAEQWLVSRRFDCVRKGNRMMLA
jgi:hypothetical protein